MIHGTNDGITTWCGFIVDEVGGWARHHDEVECIDCLRQRIDHIEQRLRKAHDETRRVMLDNLPTSLGYQGRGGTE